MKKEKRKLIKDRKFDNLKIRMQKYLFCQDTNHNGKTKAIYNRAPMTNAVVRFRDLFGTMNSITDSMRNNNDVSYDRYDRNRPIWDGLFNQKYRVVKLSATQIIVYFEYLAPRNLVNSRLGKVFKIENTIQSGDNAAFKMWHCPPMQYQSRVLITCPDVEAVNGDRVLFVKKTNKYTIIVQEDTKQKNIKLLNEMAEKETVVSQEIDVEKILPGITELQTLDHARKAANQQVEQMQALLDIELAKRTQAEYEYNEMLTKLQPTISMLSTLIEPYTFKEA